MYEAKGALTEQYVLQQLVTDEENDIFYWASDTAKAEIDFLIQNEDGIVPIEVKAEENLQAEIYMENRVGNLQMLEDVSAVCSAGGSGTAGGEGKHGGKAAKIGVKFYYREATRSHFLSISYTHLPDSLRSSGTNPLVFPQPLCSMAEVSSLLDRFHAI